MNNFIQRKLRTRLGIFKDKYFRITTIFKLLTLVVVIFLVLPFFLILVVKSGYSGKLITSTDEIRDELSTGVIISDGNKDNLKYLTELAKDAFQKRKLNYLYIYLTGDAKNYEDSAVLGLLDKIPAVSVTFERSAETPFEVCNSIKDLHKLSKILVLSFKDTATRTTFICNNFDVYAQGLIPTVNETELGIQQVGQLDYLKDITKIFVGVDLPF